MPSGMSLIEFSRSKQRKPKIKNAPEIAMMISCARRGREYGSGLRHRFEHSLGRPGRTKSGSRDRSEYGDPGFESYLGEATQHSSQ
jgi:hypothetical protein